MDLKAFTSAMLQIAEERGIPQDKVLEIIEMALAAAYKKEYGKKGQIIRAKIDPETGKARFWQVKMVVNKDMIYSQEELEEIKRRKAKGETETKTEEEAGGKKKVRFNEDRHIMLEEAIKVNPQLKPGDEFIIELEPKEEFGRIAAQTAKQVILQRIREAEREVLTSEYRQKEGQIISGVIQRVEGKNVFVDVGKTIAILPREEQIPGEFYRLGQRMRFYCLAVQETPKGPQVILSRAYPKFISRLFEMEVPEISAGTVVIKSIAREPGSRTKIAVASLQEGVDPIGAMVGQRGTRVMAVINELGGEKIDIIQYSEDPEVYIANALAPAKVTEVRIGAKNTALAIVPEDQLSLAIGKEGQNVRLAVKLTGWKIDVRSEKDILKEEESEPKKESPSAEDDVSSKELIQEVEKEETISEQQENKDNEANK